MESQELTTMSVLGVLDAVYTITNGNMLMQAQ